MSLYGGVELPDRPDPANIQRLDLLPIPMIRAMMRYGMRIDVEHFNALSSSLQSRMADLRCDIMNEIPVSALDKFMEVEDAETGDDGIDAGDGGLSMCGFNVESSQRIASLLYTTLALNSGSIRVKRTKGGALTTGKKTLEQLKREHPVVPLILEYRECAKLNGTYAQSMPRRAKLHPKGKDCPLCGRFHRTNEYRVHTKIMTTRTASGRKAFKDPNLGNIPIRTKLGQSIRAGFVSSSGCVIAQRDYAQIELRLGADRSGDENMLRIYRSDGDIHVDTAMRAFGKTLEEVTTGEGKLYYRAPCKNVNFAVFYGISDEGLLDLMAVTFATAGAPMPDWMTKQWCREFIVKWFNLYPGVRRYLDDEESKMRRFGICWTAAGRVRRIPEVRSCHSYIQEAGVRQGCNHGIQGYSADIMNLAMGELWERYQLLAQYGIPVWPLQTIYDELLIECEEDHADIIQASMEEIMNAVLVDKDTGVLRCRVPIKTDGRIMTRWEK